MSEISSGLLIVLVMSKHFEEICKSYKNLRKNNEDSEE